ncbi:hypothetical protein NC661_11690 [Aquibacillus koreensis]|uniref:Uncharacterized protein n=2 Tax=Aquibacillus koreensis TaxID=279446 RepID=A0A9X3WLH8_9BACI|nr:hypothetical protein [Aquibacillus koreensis]MCT2535174.1 hypothetical protein [Aquibacillus koreensis]MDC3421033.1 hypothetical protein [Aquibacillus koreensis]
MKKKARIILTFLLVMIIIPPLLNHYKIHEKSIGNAVVTNKHSEKENFWLEIGEVEIKVANRNTWKIIEEDEPYFIRYEWYGNKDPVLIEILPASFNVNELEGQH